MDFQAQKHELLKRISESDDPHLIRRIQEAVDQYTAFYDALPARARESLAMGDEGVDKHYTIDEFLKVTKDL